MRLGWIRVSLRARAAAKQAIWRGVEERYPWPIAILAVSPRHQDSCFVLSFH